MFAVAGCPFRDFGCLGDRTPRGVPVAGSGLRFGDRTQRRRCTGAIVDHTTGNSECSGDGLHGARPLAASRLVPGDMDERQHAVTVVADRTGH